MIELQKQRVAHLARVHATHMRLDAPSRMRVAHLWAVCISVVVALAATAFAFPEYLV